MSLRIACLANKNNECYDKMPVKKKWIMPDKPMNTTTPRINMQMFVAKTSTSAKWPDNIYNTVLVNSN